MKSQKEPDFHDLRMHALTVGPDLWVSRWKMAPSVHPTVGGDRGGNRGPKSRGRLGLLGRAREWAAGHDSAGTGLGVTVDHLSVVERRGSGPVDPSADGRRRPCPTGLSGRGRVPRECHPDPSVCSGRSTDLLSAYDWNPEDSSPSPSGPASPCLRRRACWHRVSGVDPLPVYRRRGGSSRRRQARRDGDRVQRSPRFPENDSGLGRG